MRGIKAAFGLAVGAAAIMLTPPHVYDWSATANPEFAVQYFHDIAKSADKQALEAVIREEFRNAHGIKLLPASRLEHAFRVGSGLA